MASFCAVSDPGSLSSPNHGFFLPWLISMGFLSSWLGTDLGSLSIPVIAPAVPPPRSLSILRCSRWHSWLVMRRGSAVDKPPPNWLILGSFPIVLCVYFVYALCSTATNCGEFINKIIVTSLTNYAVTYVPPKFPTDLFRIYSG